MLDYHIDQVADMLNEQGVAIGDDYSGRQVIEAARQHAKLVSGADKPIPVPINEHIRRWEDMGPGRLEVFREEDGDMILTVIDKEGFSASLQFCTYGSGGGQSPKVLGALYKLAEAILEENKSQPQHGRGPLIAGE